MDILDVKEERALKALFPTIVGGAVGWLPFRKGSMCSVVEDAGFEHGTYVHMYIAVIYTHIWQVWLLDTISCYIMFSFVYILL